MTRLNPHETQEHQHMGTTWANELTRAHSIVVNVAHHLGMPRVLSAELLDLAEKVDSICEEIEDLP